MQTKLIAVTGGIGAGKSVVSRVLVAMGYEVYDCDSKAKEIMDHDPDILLRIGEEIDPLVIVDGRIDRSILSGIVFSDSEKLEALNSIVHGAVREDLQKWREERDTALAFVETAILYESSLDKMVDAVWEVTAPTELRVNRVMNRSGLTEEAVRARIKSQEATTVTTPHHTIIKLKNDGISPILPQIESALNLMQQLS